MSAHPLELIREDDIILDCGAAPGGWSQVALDRVAEGSGRVISLDLRPLKALRVHKPSQHISITPQDFTSPITASKISAVLSDQNRPINVVLSDMLPNLSGQKDADFLKSLTICKHVLSTMENLDIAKNGNLIMKILQGDFITKKQNPVTKETINVSEYNEFMKRLKKRFKRVKIFKPAASRPESREVFLICTGWTKKK